MSNVALASCITEVNCQREDLDGRAIKRPRRDLGEAGAGPRHQSRELFIAAPTTTTTTTRLPAPPAIEPQPPQCCPPHAQGPYGRSRAELRSLPGGPMLSRPTTSRRSTTQRSRRRSPTSRRQTSSRPSQDTWMRGCRRLLRRERSSG